MNKTAFLVAIICMMTMHSCKKNNNPVVIVNAALKAAFNYMPGTYWIYKDSISGRIDSFFVTSHYDNTGAIAGGISNYETILIYVSEYSIGTTPLDTQGWTYTYASNEIDIQYVENKAPANSINYVPLINYPFSDSITSLGGGGDQDSSEVSVLSSYTVNGQTFSNVGMVNTHVYLTPPFIASALYTTNDWFYICPEAGIIKMRLNHPQDSVNRVWELQRWHIVK